MLPALEQCPSGHAHLSSLEESDHHPTLPTLTKPGDDADFATPRKPPTRFFSGLDSPAGAMLLMSPAIVGRRRHVAVDKDKDGAEISRLRHSVRVLEGTLQVEKKLVQEYYDELCIKIQELEDLRKEHALMQKKVSCLQGMADLQDELAHTNARLVAAEKDIVSYRSEVANLAAAKEKVAELEGKMGGLEYKASKCDEYKLVSSVVGKQYHCGIYQSVPHCLPEHEEIGDPPAGENG